MMPLRKAVKLGMYASASALSERFDDLVSVGLQGVEIGFDDSTRPAEIAAASATSGLEVPTLIVGQTFESSLTSGDEREREAAVSAVLRTLDAASVVGAEVVMISPGWDRAELRPDQTAGVVRDALAPAIRAAEQAGVVVAIENLWNNWLTSATDLAVFVDSFESANVGVLFDSGNAARFAPSQHWIEILGSRIVRIDLKDYKNSWARKPAALYGEDAVLEAAWGIGGPWGALDALLFDGDNDWPLIASALNESGYEGWCCAEHGQGNLSWLARFVVDMAVFSELCTSEETL
jgi:L-ribulose-5-phosphate 3-epimerase